MQKSMKEMQESIKSLQVNIMGQINGLDNRISGLDSKINGMEAEIKGLHEITREFRADSFAHFDRIYQKLDFHGTEYYAITAGMKRIEDEHRIIDHKTIFNEIQKLKSKN